MAIARGIERSPNQTIVSVGYSSGLGLALRVMGLDGRKRLMRDNGSAFHSREFRATCVELGIKHSFTRSYGRPTNVKAERIQPALWG